MQKDELLATLRHLAQSTMLGLEQTHEAADDALLAYIDDDEIAEAYNAIEKFHG